MGIQRSWSRSTFLSWDSLHLRPRQGCSQHPGGGRSFSLKSCLELTYRCVGVVRVCGCWLIGTTNCHHSGQGRWGFVAGGHHQAAAVLAESINRDSVLVISNEEALVRIISSGSCSSITTIQIGMVVVTPGCRGALSLVSSAWGWGTSTWRSSCSTCRGTVAKTGVKRRTFIGKC